MKQRIGVYICSCGTNISNALDIGELSGYSSSLNDVAYVKAHDLLCSQEGKNFLCDDVRRQKPDRIVIAACTPREHEKTFRNCLLKCGFNPYLFQMVNLREQIAWAIRDKDDANEKARLHIRAAVKRVALHEPLETRTIDCNTGALIIGAGVAGMEAALILARSGRKVRLVERNSYIGGKVMQYEEAFPSMECSSCMLAPMMDEILHHENIEVLTLSEVKEVAGFVGNFTVSIEKKAGHVDSSKCVGCGECIEQCPVTMKNAFDYRMSDRKAIDLPFRGALPNVPIIDIAHCLRFHGQDCAVCREACRFDAIDYDEADKCIERNVGGIIVATGFDSFDPSMISHSGYGIMPDVYTGLEFERILSQNGPTGGNLLMKNARGPKSIAIIHCTGNGDEKIMDYSYGVCCLYAAKAAHMIRKRHPEVKVFDLRATRCAPGGDGQSFLNAPAGWKNFRIIRTSLPMDIKVSQGKNRISISCPDIAGKRRRISVDMAVLCTPMVPAHGSDRLSEILQIHRDGHGFFTGWHPMLDTVSTALEGIYVAGCAQGPKDIRRSVTQGAAAAGKLLSALVPDRKLELTPVTAEIDGDVCSGCMICAGICPYKAIAYDAANHVAVVNEVLCKGCGICAAACPSGSARNRHFTTEQICAEISELLR